MGTSTDDSGTGKPVKRVDNVVNVGHYFDGAMDLDYKYVIYWDDDAEEFSSREFAHLEQMEFDLRDAPAEIQERWSTRRTAKSRAMDRFNELADWVKGDTDYDRGCPVCGGEMCYPRNTPDTVPDGAKRVRFCKDCNVNTYYSQNWNGAYRTAITGPGWNDGTKARLPGFLSPGSNARKRAMDHPSNWGEKVRDFITDLRDLREEVGADPYAPLAPKRGDG